ncbi:hypothetical protein SMITH_420 [Smithella sp. ME-1]|uniref:Uncharacterized protein n=1 Tax=hydrocarbon metagenome TaxID=938273 RepID=A0A0W8FP40_9ZZZZ|nr:hypothetical protein SMITH_420 [Smithella sp. ME-1]
MREITKSCLFQTFFLQGINDGWIVTWALPLLDFMLKDHIILQRPDGGIDGD